MSTQLPLLAVPEPRGGGIAWHLDEPTRQLGRLGVRQAREALRQARQVSADRPAA